MSQIFKETSSSPPPHVATTYVTDSGTATPVANILNVLGGTNANTSGSGNTIIINATPGAPNKVITDFDDFLSLAESTSKLGFIFQGASPENGTSTNPGLVTPTILSDSYTIGLWSGLPDKAPFALGAGTYSQNFVHNLVGLSSGLNSYTIYIGMMDSTSLDNITAPNSGIYFQYNHAVNGGKWQIVTNTAGTKTTNDSGVLAATGFHNYGISSNATGTSISFTIDGVATSNSPINTNIPLTNLSPGISVIISSGSSPAQLTDLFYYTQILTTAR